MPDSYHTWGIEFPWVLSKLHQHTCKNTERKANQELVNTENFQFIKDKHKLIIGFTLENIPGISLQRLDKLGRGIIIRDIEPEAMRNSSRGTLTKTERISTDKICTFCVWIIKGIEKEWCGWR